MRWRGRAQSSNVEDRRGAGRGLAVGGGGLGLLVLIVAALMNGNPGELINALGTTSGPQLTQAEQNDGKEFVSVVLADTEQVWREQFRRMGRDYREPTLVLFSGQVDSACGMAGAAMGPFYCPNDQKIYIDLSFYKDLDERFGAPGDFAKAYVVAHEVGHHVQNLLGKLDKANAMQSRSSKRDANRIQVGIELEADRLAGVWAHDSQAQTGIDRQDIQEALTAASAIGDDRLQMEAQGRVVPDSFTHGSSEQRMKAFLAGWESGRL